MPIYEYLCRDCNAEFEKMVSIADADNTPCKECGSKNTERKLSVFGVAATGTSMGSSCSSGSCDMPGSCCSTGNCPL